MRRGPALLVAVLAAAIPVKADACLLPPPPPRNPGETEEAWQKRSIEIINSLFKKGRQANEARYFEQASTIYFARIIRSEEIKVDGTPYARRVIVKPLEAIRGSLPSSNRELRDRESTSCGLEGDGYATWGAVSHIAIVFEGIEKKGFHFRSSTFSVLAAEATHPKLVDAWSRWKSHAAFLYDYGPTKP